MNSFSLLLQNAGHMPNPTMVKVISCASVLSVLFAGEIHVQGFNALVWVSFPEPSGTPSLNIKTSTDGETSSLVFENSEIQINSTG